MKIINQFVLIRKIFNVSTMIAALFAVSLALNSCSLSSVASNDTSKMNILFINVEDWNANSIGCYGNPVPKTPNIDSLASKGIRFNRAYCQAVSCGPSRASLGTGLRPDRTTVYDNSHKTEESLPDQVLSIAELLGQNGAYMVNIGKLYHGYDLARRQYMAFDRLELGAPKGYTGISKYDKSEDDILVQEQLNSKHEWTYVPDPEVDSQLKKLREKELELIAAGEEDSWDLQRERRQLWWEYVGDCGLDEEETREMKIIRATVKVIEELANDNKPFFLSVGLPTPHIPLHVPKKYMDLYDPASIPLPPSPEEATNIPDVAKRFGWNGGLFNQKPQTPDNVRQAIAAYYATSSFIDTQVGMILEALSTYGLADETIVVLTGDHGFNLGEKGLWGKYTMFEQSTRVPLVVYVPGATGNGQTSNQIVELVDLLPTFADLWDIQAPYSFEGLSFAPLLEQPDQPWKSAAFTVHHLYGGYLARSIRTQRYRYTEYRKFDPKLKVEIGDVTDREFYDLQKDPWEQYNRISDPVLEEQIAEHQKMLKQGWRSALPDR